MESFRTCLLFPSLLLLECLVLGHSTSGNNTMTSDRLQLFATWYQVRRHMISRKRGWGETDYLQSTFLLLSPIFFQKAIQEKIYNILLVVSYFLKPQGLYFTSLGQVVSGVRHASYNIYVKYRDPRYLSDIPSSS